MKLIIKTCIFLSIFSLTLFSTDLFFPYITSKIFPFRFFIEVGFFFWMLSLWSERALRFRFSEPIVRAILFFTGALFLSAFFGVNFSFSFWSNFERSEGIFSFLHYLAFFIMVLDIFKHTDYLRAIKLLLLISPLVAYYRFSDFVNVATHTYGRVHGTLGNPSYLAAFLIFVFGFGLYLIFQNRELVRSTKDSLLVVENVIWGAILLFNIPAFLLTQTRGAYIGLFFGFFVYLVFLWRKGGTGEAKFAMYSLLGIIFALFVLGFVFLATDILPQNLKDPSTLIFRFATWGSAWQGFLDKPLFGYGVENFSVAFDRHYNPIHSGVEIWFDHAHNIVFELLATTGIVGLLAYLSIFFTFFRWYLPHIIRHRPAYEAGLFVAIPTAYFVQNLSLFDTLSSYILFFLFLGLGRFVTSRESDTPQAGPHMISLRPVVLGTIIVVLVVVTVLGAYFNIAGLQKNKFLLKTYYSDPGTPPSVAITQYYRASEMSGFLGDREVMKRFGEVVHQWANNTSKFSQDDVRVVARGIEFVHEALKKDPLYLGQYYFVGNTYGVLGGRFGVPEFVRRSEEIVKKSVEMSPKRIEFIELLVMTLVNQKKYDEALPYALQMIELRPDMEIGHKWAGYVYQQKGEMEKANAEIQEALRINPSSTAAQLLKDEKKTAR